jgi:hypothetical protein
MTLGASPERVMRAFLFVAPRSCKRVGLAFLGAASASSSLIARSEAV